MPVPWVRIVAERACHDPRMEMLQTLLWPALFLSGALLLVAVVAMLVLRFRGRTLPSWFIRSTVLLFALQAGVGGIIFIRTPPMLISLAVQAVIVVWLLWRSGRRTTTGILLIATGVFGAAWWGYFLFRDLLDPFDVYEAVLWLWWAPSAILVVAGAILLPLGDRAVEQPMFPQAPSLKREPMPIGSAIQRESAIGPLPVPVIVADGAAIIASTIVIALLGHRLPWPVVWLAATAVYTVIGAELFYYAIPPRLRRAWEGMAVVGNPEMKRWQRETGSPVPVTLATMRAWLRDTPDRPAIRWARAELQAIVGELDGARESANEMPIVTDADRHEQRALLAWIDWLGGGDEQLDALQADAETVGTPDSEERADARGRVAIARARHLAVEAGDWKRPLEELRASRGTQGATLLRTDLRRGRYKVEPIVGLILTGGMLLLSGLPL
jgi:hypothetical protein